MYKNPLNADLIDLRKFYKLEGDWSRPQAKLPEMPTMDINPKSPFALQDADDGDIVKFKQNKVK